MSRLPELLDGFYCRIGEVSVTKKTSLAKDSMTYVMNYACISVSYDEVSACVFVRIQVQTGFAIYGISL